MDIGTLRARFIGYVHLRLVISISATASTVTVGSFTKIHSKSYRQRRIILQTASGRYWSEVFIDLNR